MSRSVKFSVPKLVLALAMTFGAAAALVSVGASAADPKCASLTVPAVKAECDKGGIEAVKTLMKKVSKEHKKECKDCHVDQKDFKLKDNAKKDLEAALGGAK
jgi:hypothetical protein